MATSKDFTEYVLDLLRPLGEITTSRMFSGVLLEVRGRQLGILISDTVYFKVTDVTLQEKYKNEGSEQFMYTRKDKKDPVVIKNWWSVPERAMDSSEEMVELAREVLEQNYAN